MKKEGRSFLKKRTKNGYVEPGGAQEEGKGITPAHFFLSPDRLYTVKSFLLLFFKKEDLPCLL
jgi:hypothetical protein